MINRFLWTGLILFYLVAFVKIDYWRKAAYGGDSWGYYVHLPATFIYHDIGDYSKSFEAVKQYDANLPDPKVDKYGVRPTPTGKFAVKYSHGLAVLFLPFFAIAHLFCSFTSLYPADGFSLPYMLANGLAVLFYVLLGLFFLKKLLNRHFADGISRNNREGVTWAIILSLAVATNLFYFATYNSIMSHGLLFACYCFLLFATDTFYRSPHRKAALAVGLSLGLVVLIRMNELYAVFIPLFWGVSSVQTVKERFVFLLKNFKKYILWVVLPVFLVFLPQLLYWHFVSGQWVYNAYVGETFDFRHPQITEGVFGYKNGWLPWTPVMVFSLLGLFFLKKYAKAAFLPTFLILPIHIYIIYSWWCWYYINGFGSRPMVEMYALLAFSLGAFYSFLMRLKRLGTVLLTAIVLFFSGFNLFKIYQEKQGLIWTQFSNRAFYWEMLFATQPSRAGLAAWMSNESQPKNAVKIADMISQGFEDSTLQFVTTTLKSEGQRSFESKETESGLLTIPLSKYHVQANDYIAVRLQGFFHEKDRITTFYEQAMLKMFFVDKSGQLVKDRYFRMQPFIGNPDFNIWSSGESERWGEVFVFIKVPRKVGTEGVLHINAFNSQKRPFYIDDLKVELWRQ